MPWVRLTDDWYDDPELLEAGPWAMVLWPFLISWCARNLTDGKVPSAQIPRLIDWGSLGADAEQAIAPLVANGRLQEIAGGYQITNYLTYQPSKAKVLSDRERDRTRKASQRGPASVPPESGRNPDAPVPVPVPVPDTTSSSSSSSTTETGLPDGLWTTMAEKKLTQAQGITSPGRWKRKVAENDRSDPELIARARLLLDHYDLTTSQLADVLVLGTNPPWLVHHRRQLHPVPDDAA
jgi:hypothetical protein